MAVIRGGYSADFIFGDTDTTSLADQIYGGYGNDTIYGGEGADKLYGEANDDNLNGGAGNDSIYGGSGRDTLSGGAGNDLLDGGAGDDNFIFGSTSEMNTDKVIGGDGVDTLTLFLQSRTTALNFTAGAPSTTVKIGNVSVTGVEEYVIFSGSGADIITGYLLDDTIDGGAGADNLKGLAGNDSLMGGSGNDTLNGGNNDDYVDGGSGVDFVMGANGNDFVAGGSSGDKIYGNGGNDYLADGSFGEADTSADTLSGGDGDDYVSIGAKDKAAGDAGSDTVVLNFATSTLAENFVFSSASITLAAGGTIGSFESLVFHGGKGHDKVTGGANSDQLDGGAGNDVLHGGDGSDFVSNSAGTDQIFGDVGDDSLFTGLFVGDADKYLGGDGFDTLYFGSFMYDDEGGSDIEIVEDISAYLNLADQTKNEGLLKNDTVASIEKFVGTDLDDVMIGNSSANVFYGGGSDDVLNGGAGNDTLGGGEGGDLLTGGTGNDIFEFSFGDEDEGLDSDGVWEGDIITDFVRGQDKLRLAVSEIGIDPTTSVSVVVGANPTATGSGPTLLFNTGTHELWFDADGSGGEHDALLFLTLENVTNFSQSDFTLV